MGQTASTRPRNTYTETEENCHPGPSEPPGTGRSDRTGAAESRAGRWCHQTTMENSKKLVYQYAPRTEGWEQKSRQNLATSHQRHQPDRTPIPRGHTASDPTVGSDLQHHKDETDGAPSALAPGFRTEKFGARILQPARLRQSGNSHCRSG